MSGFRWLNPVVALAVALGTSSVLAQDANAVVVRVGESSLTAADVARRFATLSPAEREALGATPAEALHNFVDHSLVPELFGALEAKARGLDKGPRFADREREALRAALEADLRSKTLAEKPVTEEEIKAYFESNETRFKQPLRIRLWRILVNDAATAKTVLEQAKAAASPAKWSELTRDKSVDKATALRQGDLGFVQADGVTDVPRVRVDPALFRAAQSLKDGEFVPQPVPEGGKFAIVWRRGSLPAKSRTLEQERDSIRGLLERRRVDDARKELLASLHTQFVHDEKPDTLSELPEGYFANKLPRPRPPLTQHAAPAGATPPSAPSSR